MRLTIRAYLELVQAAAQAEIDGSGAQVRTGFSLLQVYFGSPAQHYEVWPRPRVGRLELGLHFEGPAEENQRRLTCLAEALPEIVAGLGPDFELEQWTESWTRLHETFALTLEDGSQAEHVGRRLAQYMRVLEPIIAPLGPMPPAAGTKAGRSARRGVPNSHPDVP